MLAEKRIDLRVISHSHHPQDKSNSSLDSNSTTNALGKLGDNGVVGSGSGVKMEEKPVKENEQNVRNRAREVKFVGFIEK